jgi:hypothetical protein
MTDPECRAIMCGSTARLMMKTPSTLTRSIACSAASGMSSAGPIHAMPASLTRRSICLKREIVAATAWSISSGDICCQSKTAHLNRNRFRRGSVAIENRDRHALAR